VLNLREALSHPGRHKPGTGGYYDGRHRRGLRPETERGSA
jgi:hypothetical protein